MEGLLAHVSEVARPDWRLDFARLGQLNGMPVAMVANGPGPKLAGVAVDVVKEHNEITGLVSTGYCGGLRSTLQAGDIFVASEVVGVAPSLAPAVARSFKSGKLLSIDRVVTTAREKSELGGQADAVEMEAAAVAGRAKQWDLPFYAVRVVTDTWNESFPLEFNHMRSEDGRFSRSRVMLAALGKPFTVLPGLMKLNRTTKRASVALGDFLADARF